MSENIPKWLTDALPPREEWQTVELGEAGKDIEPGAICIASGPNKRGHVLIEWLSEVNGEHYAQAYLLSKEVEIGTDADFVLEPEETGLSYRMLLESDISGPMRVQDLQRISFGEVKAGASLEIVELARDRYHRSVDPSVIRFRPLSAPDDDRWAWKQEQIGIMHDLMTPAMNQLLN